MSLPEEVLKVHLEDMWPVMKEQIDSGGSVRFGPKGISMLPLIRQGLDTVVLEKAPDTLKKYDIPLYRRKDGQFVLHRVVGINKNGYITRGDNQVINEFNVKHSQVLAIVTGFYREDKYVSVNDPEYLKYVKKHMFSKNISAFIVRVRSFLRRMAKTISGKK